MKFLVFPTASILKIHDFLIELSPGHENKKAVMFWKIYSPEMYVNRFNLK